MQSTVASFEILVKKVAICIVSDFAGALNMVLANELGNRLKLSPLESWPLKIHDRDAPENFLLEMSKTTVKKTDNTSR